MGLPEEIEGKLDSDSSWTIQHKDIVQTMDNKSKQKPWSRYMIQQHLDEDPAKKTVQDRLDELVELDVLDKYEYTNQTLYDLAYDPIVTDGGRLKDANVVELVTFQDQRSVRDLVRGMILTSAVLLGIGILAGMTQLTTDLSITGNFYVDAGVLLYFLGLGILLLMGLIEKFSRLLPDSNSI